MRGSKLYVALMVTVLLLVGCGNKREINELALVMAVGLDKGENEQIEVTIQVVRPADARGQTGAPSGQTGDPIWAVSSEGESIFDAIRNLASFSTRRVFWAHNFAIVINEDLAKEGIQEILDFFTRNPELRMRTWMIVTPDKAKDVVATLTGLEVVPGEAIDKLYRYSPITAVAPRTELREVHSAYLSESSEPYISRVELIDRGVSNKKPGQSGAYKQIQLSGTGIFKDDKMVGTLTSEETMGFLPFIEKVESGVTVLVCPSNDKKKITIETVDYDFKIEPSYKKNKPSFAIGVKVKANVVEAECPFTIKNKKEVAQLEAKLEETITNNIQTVLDKAQNEYRSDFLKLGKVFHNRYPGVWRKLGEEWEEEFSKSKVTVSVDAHIKSSVLLYNPTKSGKH